MYSIAPTIAENYSTNAQLNRLIDNIDLQIMKFATYEYNAIRLGTKSQLDLQLYYDLLTYKEILLDVLMGCNCLTDEYLLLIVYKIKKLLNNGIRL